MTPPSSSTISGDASRQTEQIDHVTDKGAPTMEENSSQMSNGSGRSPHASSLEKSRTGKRRRGLGAVYDILSYTPRRCRYDPDQPARFSTALNVLFAFAGCFTVANLYYTHPILNLLARDFKVTDQQASFIPTLAQSGYCAGLLFLNPLGDLLKRRPFVLWLVFFTATLWIGLCTTTSYHVFCAITFITGVTTVTPQLMMPLVGDLAPKEKRATALSIVVSGLLLGMLIARLLSGVVANLIGWRYIYWIALALQYLILILLWLCMPDYPSTNPTETWQELFKVYPGYLWDIVTLFFTHGVVWQACLISFCTSATFTSYWTTLTFLLAGAPYHYNSLIIGLFALIGIGAMSWGPFFARFFMDRHQPLASTIIGVSLNLVGTIIGCTLGLHSVAGPIIQAALLDIGLQTSQIANRTAIYQVAPNKKNRVNTTYMVMVFSGQLAGTGIGNALYAHGGWVESEAVNIAFVATSLILCLVRGPHETRWIGWRGGWSMKLDHGQKIKPPVVADEESRPEAFEIGAEVQHEKK